MTDALDEELAHATRPDPARPRRLHVLVLDDDETDRLRLARVLRTAGFAAEVTEVEDIAGFGPALDRRVFDLVFIDFWLGFETGLDALDLLSVHPRQPRAVPVMLSHAELPEVIVGAMRAGCADYIVKGALDVDTLRAAVAAALERRILLAALRETGDLRCAVRRLVDRLAQGRVRAMAEASDPYVPRPGRLRPPAASRLSAGLLADLELLWHLRRA